MQAQKNSDAQTTKHNGPQSGCPVSARSDRPTYGMVWYSIVWRDANLSIPMQSKDKHGYASLINNNCIEVAILFDPYLMPEGDE